LPVRSGNDSGTKVDFGIANFFPAHEINSGGRVLDNCVVADPREKHGTWLFLNPFQSHYQFHRSVYMGAAGQAVCSCQRHRRSPAMEMLSAALRTATDNVKQ
jgi:hypothetical protein